MKPSKRLWRLMQEVEKEMRKVTWPTPKMTLQMTLIVVVVVFIASIFLWAIDSGILGIIRWFTDQ